MKAIHSINVSNLIPLKRSNPLVNSGYSTVFSDWLGRFTSPHTVRVYRHAINEFFRFLAQQDDVLSEAEQIELLAEFLLLEQSSAYELVAQYESYLVHQLLAPATINRKLASIKSLVTYASQIGKCFYTLSNIKTKTVTVYRDTTGISCESFKEILATVDRSTLKGKRDYAILLLLWGNALRRSEVTSCQIKHFEPKEKRLWILGKGKKGQLEVITLGTGTIKAIQIWLEARENSDFNSLDKQYKEKLEENPQSKSLQNQRRGKTQGNANGKSLISSAPLFCAVHKGYWGHQLNTDSIYKLVKKYASLAGIEKAMSPHRLRHSAITAALEATNGDVRSVQKLSRHSSLNTLMIYDDNRRNEQGRVTQILENLL